MALQIVMKINTVNTYKQIIIGSKTQYRLHNAADFVGEVGDRITGFSEYFSVVTSNPLHLNFEGSTETFSHCSFPL